MKNIPPVGVCATCPWRLANQGKPHPAGWYRLTNLRRIWNGIRSGRAPGFVCHATDPNSTEYGGTKPVPKTAKPRECGGMLLIIFRHFEMLAKLSPQEYKLFCKLPMKPRGICLWVERRVFGNTIPEVTCEDPEAVGLPWD